MNSDRRRDEMSKTGRDLQSAKALESELRKIEERKAQIEARLEAAHLCSKRLSSFKPEIQGISSVPVAGLVVKRDRH